jgi:hypothetical protein
MKRKSLRRVLVAFRWWFLPVSCDGSWYMFPGVRGSEVEAVFLEDSVEGGNQPVGIFPGDTRGFLLGDSRTGIGLADH